MQNRHASILCAGFHILCCHKNRKPEHLRKEVIQPHLPVRLPCYDLVLLTNHTFADILLAVRYSTSGAISSDHLTGGVYKTRERIHPVVADTGLLTIPAS